MINITKCKYCKRVLKNLKSILNQMGNHCAKKHGHKFIYKLPDKLQRGLGDFE